MHRATLKAKVNDLEAMAQVQSHDHEKIVYGVCDMQRNVLRSWQYQKIDDKWQLVQVDKAPDVLIPENLEKLLTVPKKYKVIYGGRGGTKSITIMNLMNASMNDFGDNIMCFREVQKSIKSSVFKGMVGQIKKCNFLN